VQIAQRMVPARREGFGQLVQWARTLDSERVWVIEDSVTSRAAWSGS
jgi:hypothetical protein